jgi:hypothetical protein
MNLPESDPTSARSTTGDEPSLVPWANTGLEQPDSEIRQIHQMELRVRPLPPVALRIRELITRLELCHFKVERHVNRIVAAIGTLRLDLNPADIGRAHPRCGENAWRNDRTGISRRGQEYIWALQMWLADTRWSESDPRRVPRELVERVNGALGNTNASKVRLVSALVNRLVLRPDRQPLPPELGAFWLQVEATDICHYAFPANLERMLEAIGRLQPVPEFVGCGSFDEARRELARESVRALGAWLRGQPSRLADQLGDRTPLKEWLAACLAKTLKELAHGHDEHLTRRARIPDSDLADA